MIKVLKWESLKLFHKIKWIVLGYVLLLLVLRIYPVNSSQSKSMQFILLTFSLLLMIGTSGFVLYPLYNMIGDFKKSYHVMERTTHKPYIYILIAKIAMNLCSFLIASGIGYYGMEFMKKFRTEHTNYFNVAINRPYFDVLIGFVYLYPVILLFCYLLGSVLPVFNKYKFIGIGLGIVVVLYISSKITFEIRFFYLLSILVSFILVFISSRIVDQYYKEV